MTTTYRRPRGTAVVQLHVTLAPQVKARIDAIAERPQAPLWAVVEAALKAGTEDANGIPVEWNLSNPDAEALPGVEGSQTAA